MILFASVLFLTAQDVNEKLKEASASYQSGDYENARFALQEALNGINQVMGQEILSKLPATMGDMDKVENSDDVTGTNMGFAGLYVSREYKGETSDASFNIISDSPMLAGISTMLSMSVFMATNPDQKKIKVEGYKVLLTRNAEEEGKISFDFQLPFGNSLMSFTLNGVADEKTAVGIFEQIPVSEIVQTAQ